MVELTLFRRLLALGAALLQLFLLTRAAGRSAEPVLAPDGTRLTAHDQRPTTSDAVFGNVRFERHCFTAPGQKGFCPLDAELSLPARCYADRLREWAVYGTTDAPYPRTPQDGVGALLQEPGGPEPAARPRPEGTELRATLAGQAVALSRLAQRVAQRDGPASQPRVALTAGAEALQQPWGRHLPEHTLVREIIHATESRWDTANALLGEPHPQRLAWVHEYLEALLAGQTDAVITALEAEGKAPTWTGAQRRAGLDLRAVRLNGQWDRNWPFHRHQQHQRLYGTSAPVPERAEGRVLELAA